MSREAHIMSLQAKHRKIDDKISMARLHHMPVDGLKKRKLRIKDEITSLSNFVREESLS